MRTRTNRSPARHMRRQRERGAALLMMLLVATLILAAGGALILSSALTGTNAADATAEKQAYYAAEAGLQMSMNALRGNMAHDSAVANGTRMNFRTAVTPDLSNGVGRSPNNDPCVADTPNLPSPCRLQGWLPYNSNGVVPVDPNGSSSFRTTVYDPDQSHRITYSTSGQFRGLNGIVGSILGPNQIKLGGLLDFITITFVPKPATTINANQPTPIDLGSFRVQKSSLLAALPLNLGAFATFDLTVTQTSPWQGTTVFKNITLGTPGILSCPLQLFRLNIPQPGRKAGGTDFIINSNLINVGCPPAVNAAVVEQIQATLGPPPPRRLVVRTVGFGPHFARKQMEMSVSRADLLFEVPATLTVRGADDCSALNFNTGNSNAQTYTGNDHGNPPEAARPAIAVRACDYDDVVGGTGKPNNVTGSSQVGIMAGPPGGGALTSETVDTPDFLQTANAARAYLNDLQTTAIAQGRYFKPAPGTPYASNEGTASNPAFTFVDGDCNLTGGAGFLIVTGELNMSGNPSFDGVILVLGEGRMNRNGGGSGDISGAIVLAKFARTWDSSENGLSHPFLAPTFNTNGGGNADVQYNSTAIERALSGFGARVTGVLEY